MNKTSELNECCTEIEYIEKYLILEELNNNQ